MPDINYILNDPSTPHLMAAVDLPPAPATMKFRIDGYKGPAPVMYSPEHQAACCHFTIVKNLEIVNRHLPKPPQKWAATQTLFVQPRAGKQFNAYYDRQALRFFYAADPVTKNVVYAVNSTDVVAHELGHAILDAVRPDLYNVQAMEVWAFHEAFGDINAILHMLHYNEVMDLMIQETGGDLRQANIATKLAEEMGTAIYHTTAGRMGHTSGALRNAVNSFKYTEPERLPRKGMDNQLLAEPHSFARVYVGAWYDLLVGIYESLRSMGYTPKDALMAARDVMAKYTLAALPLAPATVRFFDAMARAMLVIDKANNYQYNTLMNQVFLSRGILKQSVRPLLSLDWQAFQPLLEPEDEIYTHASGLVAVRNKKIEQLSLPEFMVNVEAPGDSFYEFNGDGSCVNVLAVSAGEMIDHAMECVAFLKENDMIRSDRQSPFEITEEGDLIRTHFACGCLGNAKIKTAPEFNKGYKAKNHSGCGCKTKTSGQSAASVSCRPSMPAVSAVCITEEVLTSRKQRDCTGSTTPTPTTGEPVLYFSKVTLVPANVETTVVSTVVPAGKTLHLQGFTAQGNTDAVYRLYIGSAAKLSARTSVAQPTTNSTFLGTTIPATEGVTVAVKVEHYAPVPCEFEGTIVGLLK